MKAHLPLSLVSLFFLAGCLDSSGPLEGNISGLSISGLKYQTDSKSGVTDSAGQFEYKKGDSITFSLHGLDLFTASASSSITLESLLGFALPRNQGALLEKLESRSRHPEFHRQINRFQILALSDSDQDLSNGINLEGITELDLSSLDLERSARSFYNDNHLTIAGDESAITLQDMFKTFYTAVGIDVQAQLLTRKINDEGNDDTEDGYASFEYNEEGYLIGYEEDWQNRGCLEEEYAITTNEAGETLHTEYERELNDSQVCTQSSFWQQRFSVTGAELGYARTFDFNVDGVLNSHYVSTASHDDQGNIITEIVDRSTDGDTTFDERTTYTHTYENGNRVKVEWVTASMEGVVRETASTEYTYDESDNIVKSIYEVDKDNNPVTANNKSITDYTYDENGNQTLYDYQYFADGAETPNYRNVHRYTYDAQGNTLTRIYANYNGTETPHQEYGYTYTYNEKGLRKTYDYFWKDNGELVQVRHTEYEYDEQGRELSETEWDDSRNDGDTEYDSMERYSYRYDEQGREVYENYEEDDELDGVFEYFESSSYEYNADDQITKETYLEGERSIVNEGLEDEAINEITSSKSEELYSYNDQGNLTKITTYDYEVDETTGSFPESPDTESAELRTYENTDYGIVFMIDTYMDSDHPFDHTLN